jgi:hypothetical protein
MANITAMKPGNENLSVMMQHSSEGVHLWKWCIILALLFLAQKSFSFVLSYSTRS